MAREKELEAARLRAQQEKHADTAAAMDELRAQRIQEAHERAYREKERAAAERERAINEDLRVAREYQKMLKMKQLSDQARQERDEFFRVIDVQMQKEEEDANQAAQLAAMRRQHKEELQSQIAYNEEMRRRERREYLEEGDRVRANLTAEGPAGGVRQAGRAAGGFREGLRAGEEEDRRVTRRGDAADR